MDEHRSAASRGWYGCFALVLVALVGSALLGGLDRVGGRDWDEFQADTHAARRSLLSRGELPLWMPHRAGGHDAFAEPQSTWLSPLGVLTTCCGDVVGPRLFFALVAGFGGLGALLLGRRLGAGTAGGAAMALLLFAGPHLGLYAAGGIPTFAMGSAVLPWLVLAVLRRSPGALCGAGALLSLCLYGGDVVHFIYHAFLLALLIPLLALRAASPRRIADLVLIALAAFVLSAPKLIPTLMFARDHPRVAAEERYRGMTPRLLAHVLLNREAVRVVEAPFDEFVDVGAEGQLVPRAPRRRHEPGPVDWVNVGIYVGVPGVLLALLGAARALRRPRRPEHGELLVFCGVGLVFLWIAGGRDVVPSLWETLQQLPVLSSTRRPARLVLYPVFGLVCLAGLGLSGVVTWLRHSRGRTWAIGAAGILLAALLVDVHPPARRAYRQAFVEPRTDAPLESTFVQRLGVRPKGSTFYGVPVYPAVLAGVGVVNGYTGGIPVDRRAIPREHPSYRGEAFFTGAGSVRSFLVTSRRIEVEVEVEEPDTLVINQNYARGWHAVEPSQAARRVHTDGRLSVGVPQGASRVVLVYTPPGLGLGIGVFLAGLPLLWWLARRHATPSGVS